jgi:ATP synthase A chain
VIWFGIRTRGLSGYLKTFAEPTFLMIPLNVVETFTRTFSLIVRLFGNVMSGAFIIGIILSLAGLIVPIPFMGIEMLIGAIQAYIFTVLAMVFIGSAIKRRSAGRKQGKDKVMNWLESSVSPPRPSPCRSVRSGRRWRKGARSPPPWTLSPGNRKPQEPCHGHCSSASR